MAVTLEQVERLREEADLSYEEARALLEQTQGDLLEALILLERQGRTRGAAKSAYYSTRPSRDAAEGAALVPTAPSRGGRRRSAGQDAERPGFRAQLKALLLAAVDLLRHSTVNQFEVWRHGEMMTSLPVLILILLILVAFWISVPLLLLGLFFGCRYRFSGPDLEKSGAGDAVNRVTGVVGDAVEQVKDAFTRAAQGKDDPKKEPAHSPGWNARFDGRRRRHGRKDPFGGG